MKKLFFVAFLTTTINAYADITHTSQEPPKATAQEISRNRACFEELKVQGCGDPGDDFKQFRSCMSNVYDSLSESCQKMMSDLYGKK